MFSRSAGRFPANASASRGKADLFSSVLHAQNARPGLAELTRDAQNSPAVSARLDRSSARHTERSDADRAQSRDAATRRNEQRSADDSPAVDAQNKEEETLEADDADAADDRVLQDENPVAEVTHTFSQESPANFAIAHERTASSSASIGSEQQRTDQPRLKHNPQNQSSISQSEVAMRTASTRANAHTSTTAGDVAATAPAEPETPSQPRNGAIPNEPAVEQRIHRAANADQIEVSVEPKATAASARQAQRDASAEQAARHEAAVARAVQTAIEGEDAAAEQRFAVSGREASPQQASDLVAQQQTEQQRERTARRTAIDGVSVRPNSDSMKPAAAPRSQVQQATDEAIDALVNGERQSLQPASSSQQPPQDARQTANADAAMTRTATPSAIAPSQAVTAESTPGTSISASLVNAATGHTAAHSHSVTALAGEAGSSSSSNTGSEWMTRNDHAAGRIIRGLSTMVHQNGGTMTMRLDPPELGAIRIQMTITNGSVTASFAPSSEAARQLLEQSMSQLRTALESQGLFVDRLSIQHSQASQSQQQLGQQQSEGRTGQESASNHANAGEGESRGRGEYEQQERRSREFFDPALLFDPVVTSEPGARFKSSLETRISA